MRPARNYDLTQLFSTAVNGQVYAQPLVIGSHVIVATEDNWVYGLNSVTGAVAWSVSLGTPWDQRGLRRPLARRRRHEHTGV